MARISCNTLHLTVKRMYTASDATRQALIEMAAQIVRRNQVMQHLDFAGITYVPEEFVPLAEALFESNI